MRYWRTHPVDVITHKVLPIKHSATYTIAQITHKVMDTKHSTIISLQLMTQNAVCTKQSTTHSLKLIRSNLSKSSNLYFMSCNAVHRKYERPLIPQRHDQKEKINRNSLGYASTQRVVMYKPSTAAKNAVKNQ